MGTSAKERLLILYPVIILSRFPLVMFHYISDLGHVIGMLLLHVPLNTLTPLSPSIHIQILQTDLHSLP